MWAEETSPPRILTPGDDLLMDAVSFNMDGLVEAILCLQPKIVADPESQRTDYENALLLAIGNAWEFSEEAEAQAANRATSLPEINHGPLSVHGWKHRAERIVSMLKAVGAVDYRPLLAACRVGDLSEVERLLECGFPPNYGLYMQTTPLLEAVRGGHADVCACLLRHGANPDLKWPDDGTPVFKEMEHPLQLAIDQPEIFKLLIEGGVDPTTCGEDGKPLIFRGNYASRVHAETIFGLVEFGSLRGKDQRTGVHDLDARDLALCWDFVPQDLLEKNDLSAMTPLLDAIRRADSSKALFLLDHGADPLTTSVAWSHQVLDIPPPHFRRSESLRHLEHWAMGRIETMTDGEPANADELPTMILTPIQVALLSQNIEVVEKLLELGAKADPKVIALYPFRETARQAKADIIARLTEEPELPAKIKVECSEAPEHAIVWVELACRVINVLLHEPDKAARYPEMVEELDLLRWAEYERPHPAVVEPFRTGRKLDKTTWLDLAEKSLTYLNQQADKLARDLANDARLGTFTTNGAFLLETLDHAETAWMQARLRITGQAPEHLSLSAESCERALGTFVPQIARTRRKRKMPVNSWFDDFIAYFYEPMPHGTTIDLSKLVQAVRMVTTRLKKRCTTLSKNI
jgi:ankyrin repeat protein